MLGRRVRLRLLFQVSSWITYIQNFPCLAAFRLRHKIELLDHSGMPDCPWWGTTSIFPVCKVEAGCWGRRHDCLSKRQAQSTEEDIDKQVAKVIYSK